MQTQKTVGGRACRPPCPEGLLGHVVEPDDLFWPKLGSRASCTTSNCAISAKLCPRNVWSDERNGRRGAGRRTPNDPRSDSGLKSVLFTCRMLVSAVHRSEPWVLLTRLRISLGGRCLDCS